MERDQIIAEVARTTGVRLDRSDPILAAAVISEALLNEALVRLDRQVTVQADRVTAASTQAVTAARKQADVLITESADWLEKKFEMACQAGVDCILRRLQDELDSVERTRQKLERLLWLASAIGLIAISFSVGLAAAGLH